MANHKQVGDALGIFTKEFNGEYTFPDKYQNEHGLELSKMGYRGEAWFLEYLAKHKIPCRWNLMFINDPKYFKYGSIDFEIFPDLFKVGLRSVVSDRHSSVLYPMKRTKYEADIIVFIHEDGSEFSIIGWIPYRLIHGFPPIEGDEAVNLPKKGAIRIPKQYLRTEMQLLELLNKKCGNECPDFQTFKPKKTAGPVELEEYL